MAFQGSSSRSQFHWLLPTKLALAHVMDKKPAAKFMAAGASDVGRSSFSKIFLLK
jgi:hypothetical protein